MKAIFLKIIAAIITSVLLIPAGIGGGADYDVREPENCRFNFCILSDSHIEGNNFNRYKVFTSSLQNIKKNKSGNDAVVFLGDNTMNGQTIENLLFHGAVGYYLKNEKIVSVMGNHDIGNGEGDYEKLQNRWYTYTNGFFGKELTHPYYYEVIGGYYFIVLGMEAQEVHEMQISEEQFTWLENVLAEAAGSGKPVFVFSHMPMDYAEDLEGNPTDRLMDLLAAYNEENDIFCFVGHTHMPLYNFWSFHTSDGYPETYLPRLTELYGGDDNEIGKNSGVGIEVEIYENEVQIRGRNFYTGEWCEDDDGPIERTYSLKKPVSLSDAA